MDNVSHLPVIRQLLSLLPPIVQERLVAADRYAKKLTITKSILVFVAAQLNRWSSYEEMESKIRAESELQSILQLQSISGAQLSRKLEKIPTEILQTIFLHGLARIQQLTANHTGITASIGRLAIIDSSTISLPLRLGDWARMTKDVSGVKMHLRLLAVSPDTVFPDAVVPTTKNVGDRAVTVDLVVESDVTYVMDRGYDDYKRMDEWINNGIRFVMRMRERSLTTVLKERPLSEGSNIIQDADVQVGASSRGMKNTVRLVEFYDDQGRFYRLFTSRWDISAEEVAHIYKCRWLVELFFKWTKQHLRLVKVHSYKPQALWNQIFLALIAYQLVAIVQLTSQTKKTTWRVLELLRTYMYHGWHSFQQALYRVPARTSQGRRAGGTNKPVTLKTEVGILRTCKVES
jgi:Transposase DDE domain